MPLSISSNATIEKNKITSDSVWLLLLEIIYPDESAVLVCLNNTTISWNSRTWLPAIFGLSGMSETKDAEIPGVTLTVSDIYKTLTPIVDRHTGGLGATAIIRVVNSKYLSNTTPELEETMEIIGCNINSKNDITFKLGAENLVHRKCPKNRYLRNHCRFVFKGPDHLCGYTGAATECNLTFSRCEELGNLTRFGGFPAVGNRGILK